MKIIDVLNLKAKGELEDGFKFVYNNRVFGYNKKMDSIKYILNGYHFGGMYVVDDILNDEIELIKEK